MPCNALIINVSGMARVLQIIYIFGLNTTCQGNIAIYYCLWEMGTPLSGGILCRRLPFTIYIMMLLHVNEIIFELN